MMRARPSYGFTLLELLVAIVVFSILAVMAYGGLNGIIRNRGHIEQVIDRTAAFQRSYQKLRGDLQQVRNRPVRDNFGDAQPPLRGDRDTRIEFTRAGWRNPLVQQRSSLERVSYRLVEKELRRESWRVLDQAQDSKLVSVTLLKDVDEMRLRYMDSKREWVETWPPLSSTGGVQSATSVPPPMAVEITLKTKDWGDIVYLFRLGLDAAPAGQSGAPGQPGQPGGQTGQPGGQRGQITTE